MAGMIHLRKKLQDIPIIPVADWQSLSQDRLAKLLAFLGEWPELSEIIAIRNNVWNSAKPESFDGNPNATNEIQAALGRMVNQLESLEETRLVRWQLASQSLYRRTRTSRMPSCSRTQSSANLPVIFG